MRLSPLQVDRAVGALLGTAAGDALGAKYEFGPPLPDTQQLDMDGGGPWARGVEGRHLHGHPDRADPRPRRLVRRRGLPGELSRNESRFQGHLRGPTPPP